MREGEALFTPIKTDLYFLMRASFKKEVFENETFFPLKAASVFGKVIFVHILYCPHGPQKRKAAAVYA